jgi:actin-related protein
MNKYKWFKFYFAYNELFESLNCFRLKKIFFAMVEYAENGTIPKLNKKNTEIFNKIKLCIDTERENFRKYGSNGAKKRWNKAENRVSKQKK